MNSQQFLNILGFASHYLRDTHIAIGWLFAKFDDHSPDEFSYRDMIVEVWQHCRKLHHLAA